MGILKLTTTWGQIKNLRDPTNNNEFVFKMANTVINTFEARVKENGSFRKWKIIHPLSHYYKMQRRKAIIDLINKEDTEISKFVCVEPGTLKLQEYNFKKLGGQAYHWWEKGLE